MPQYPCPAAHRSRVAGVNCWQAALAAAAGRVSTLTYPNRLWWRRRVAVRAADPSHTRLVVVSEQQLHAVFALGQRLALAHVTSELCRRTGLLRLRGPCEHPRANHAPTTRQPQRAPSRLLGAVQCFQQMLAAISSAVCMGRIRQKGRGKGVRQSGSTPLRSGVFIHVIS
jgi:hypothetical protein